MARTRAQSTCETPGDDLTEMTKDREAVVVRRKMGDTELSYYLPSRENGVNDMYVNIGFRAPSNHVARARVRAIWAILRQRHPLLASKARMETYENVMFEYNPLDSVKTALSSADSALGYISQGKDDMISTYLNGPRTLSDERLSYLYISSPDHVDWTSEKEQDFICMMCATHCIGDGMALYSALNDFFILLGGDGDESELRRLLDAEMDDIRRGSEMQLPREVEKCLPETPSARIYGAIATVDYLVNQRKQIGGQTFPKRSGKSRYTVVPTVSFDAEKTKMILKKCKENGVSASSAVFALCNVAWARTCPSEPEQPTLLYSAQNLRAYFQRANEKLNDSYFSLAIGYFNVILPSFFPEDVTRQASTFWHRARSVKSQTTRLAKSPMAVSRCQLMAKERGLRSRIWGMQDDGVECDISMPKLVIHENDTPAPSKALLGLSLLGNLDGVFKHESYSRVTLHSITNGSRQRPGAMLLFGYTFVGKFWLSLGYDANGFDDEVVQRFWGHLVNGVDEFLCN